MWREGVYLNIMDKLEKVEKEVDNNDRQELSGRFAKALLKDFKKHGKEAIELVRTRAPGKYLDLIAAVLPKEVKDQKHLHLNLIRTLKDLGKHGLEEEVINVVQGPDIIRNGGSWSEGDGAVPEGGFKGTDNKG